VNPPPPQSAPAQVCDRVPGRGALAHFGFRVLSILGWRVVLAQPVPKKCVVVFYPHTSNWDFVFGLLAKWAMGIDFRWLGKHTLFRSPLAGWFVRHGGIPVDRGNAADVAREIGRSFDAHDEFRLVITPEGTRRRTEYWKSGFHRIARAADVPLGLAFIDRATRSVGIGAWVAVTGDAEADLVAIRAFYADKRAWDPSRAGAIRLRERGPG
jgi:1-acyl-sn-glycerol-3-phosphate acyltransferase